MQLQPVLLTGFSALTVNVSNDDISVMDAMTVETGLMKKTVAYRPVNTITVHLLLYTVVHYYIQYYLSKL